MYQVDVHRTLASVAQVLSTLLKSLFAKNTGSKSWDLMMLCNLIQGLGLITGRLDTGLRK